jgi:hypothetical protein
VQIASAADVSITHYHQLLVAQPFFRSLKLASMAQKFPGLYET